MTDPAVMTVDEAVRVVARQALCDVLDTALECIGWEDYPDIGERDFAAVLLEVARLVENLPGEPDRDVYDAAYALLAGRAGPGTW